MGAGQSNNSNQHLLLTRWHVDVSFHSLALSGACYYDIHSSEWKQETHLNIVVPVITIKCRLQRFWADIKCDITAVSHGKSLYRIQNSVLVLVSSTVIHKHSWNMRLLPLRSNPVCITYWSEIVLCAYLWSTKVSKCGSMVFTGSVFDALKQLRSQTLHNVASIWMWTSPEVLKAENTLTS